MLSHKPKKTLLFILLISSLFVNGCWVGTQVAVEAPTVKYPVSHSNYFYTQNDKLITPDMYTVNHDFVLSFSRWGVGFPLDVEREEDISNELNKIIVKNQGDAIVNLTFAISNPDYNTIFMVAKSMSFIVSLIAIPVAIADPSQESTLVAGGFLAAYLFSPALMDIEVSGQVVKTHEQ